MNEKIAVFDSALSKELSVNNLIDLYRSKNVKHIYYKILSPNDNSKNQPYLGGHLTDLAFMPTGEILETPSNSGKTSSPKRRIKYLVALDFLWVSPEGSLFPAPDAKLIYYPQYPEVRLSGFVAHCGFDMNGWMDPQKKGRSEGRVLFFGVTESKKILAYLAVPDSRIAKEIVDFPSVEITGVFNEVNVDRKGLIVSSKDILLEELKRIHQKSWIEGKKLNKDGIEKRYIAPNGGGYTLEAELGVTANGYADPDFMGWEIKQFGVSRCDLINSKVLTVMTPEPDGGYYVDNGVADFMRKYGYESPTTADRLDFTGRHLEGEVCSKSGLMLVTQGYDQVNKLITEAAGYIALVDKDDNLASSWSFGKLMEHWKRKHAKAAYIPSLSRKNPDNSKSYHYCNNVRLFEGTSFLNLLEAIIENHVYYDPGIKLENFSTSQTTKRRNQFRIKSQRLSDLYEKQSDIDLLSI